jgi:glucosamine-6-phosphate deaminase
MYIDRLKVKIYESREGMGEAAAGMVAEKINELFAGQEIVNIIFAAAPSQNEFLEHLTGESIEWQRINAFHMDEYIGLEAAAPQGFGNFLRDRIFDKVPFNQVFYLNGGADNVEEECKRYEEVLKQYPADIVCMGIGENGHVAFNDPPVADFNDERLVKIVKLDEASRMQQVHDGCFAALEEVPQFAITLTIPALMQAKYTFCMVPGYFKAEAVYNTLTRKIEHQFPSTILRTHERAVLFLDRESSRLINFESATRNN